MIHQVIQIFMLEIIGLSQKRNNFLKNLLVNFRLTTVINLHQSIFTQIINI